MIWQAGKSRDSEKFRVTLDGEPMPLAILADTDKGEVVTYATTPLAVTAMGLVVGQSTIQRDVRDKPRTLRLTGRVEILPDW